MSELGNFHVCVAWDYDLKRYCVQISLDDPEGDRMIACLSADEARDVAKTLHEAAGKVGEWEKKGEPR